MPPSSPSGGSTPPSPNFWIGCVAIPDLPAWAIEASGTVDDPFYVLEAGRVVGASRGSRLQGVEPGQTEHRARVLAADARAVARDPALEDARWLNTLDRLHRITPRIDAAAPGLAYFEPIDADALRAFTRAVGQPVGIATTRALARLAAHALTQRSPTAGSSKETSKETAGHEPPVSPQNASPGKILCIRPEAERTFLARTSPRVLPDLGYPEDLAERLQLFGYSTLADTQSLTQRHLDAQFGNVGTRLYRFLHADPDRVTYYVPPDSLAAEAVMERPAREPGPVNAAIQRCAEDLEERLGRRACRRLTLELDTGDDTLVRSRALLEPRRSARVLRQDAEALLRPLLGAYVHALRLKAGSLREPGGSQADLFFQKPGLERAIRAVQARFPGALLRVTRERDAVFEDERFRYDQRETVLAPGS